ncbi:MAG: phosphoribosylanthranilate isomerase [Litorivicinus sp.]
MTRTKICGITQPAQVAPICDLGVDALGVVFYPPSPRSVDVEQAKAIRQAMPAYVTLVGLFVDHSAEQINQIADQVGLDAIQFHGDHSVDECQRSNRPWYRALRVAPGADINALVQPWVGQGQGILLDTYVKGVPGGTGESFNWQAVPAQRNWNLILAGGLTPANVKQAVQQTTPWAVDVSGGVEASPGVKDIEAVRTFMQEVPR